jgi:hypothetical protein
MEDLCGICDSKLSSDRIHESICSCCTDVHNICAELCYNTDKEFTLRDVELLNSIANYSEEMNLLIKIDSNWLKSIALRMKKTLNLKS